MVAACSTPVEDSKASEPARQLIDACGLNVRCEDLRELPSPLSGRILEPFATTGSNAGYSVILVGCADDQGVVMTTLEHRLEDWSWFQLPTTPVDAPVTITFLAQGRRAFGAFVYPAGNAFEATADAPFPERSTLDSALQQNGKLVPPNSYTITFNHTAELSDVSVDFFDDHSAISAHIGSRDPKTL